VSGRQDARHACPPRPYRAANRFRSQGSGTLCRRRSRKSSQPGAEDDFEPNRAHLRVGGSSCYRGLEGWRATNAKCDGRSRWLAGLHAKLYEERTERVRPEGSSCPMTGPGRPLEPVSPRSGASSTHAHRPFVRRRFDRHLLGLTTEALRTCVWPCEPQPAGGQADSAANRLRSRRLLPGRLLTASASAPGQARHRMPHDHHDRRTEGLL